MKRLLLVIGFAAALAGCTQKAEAPASTPAPEPAATEVAPEASPPAAGPAGETSAAPAAASTAAARPTPGPIPGNWQAGVNYELISPAQITNVDPGQVEIIEFMWLGCPHCYELNPFIESWKNKAPAYVAFRQEHVTWDAQRLPHAKLFYTLKALGAGDDVIVKAFEEIHRRGNMLMASRADASEQLQEQFAAANGLNAAAFRREYDGFTVKTSIKRADDMIRRYRINQVPTIIVNGKYRTDVGMAGSPEKLTQLLNDLATSEKGN